MVPECFDWGMDNYNSTDQGVKHYSGSKEIKLLNLGIQKKDLIELEQENEHVTKAFELIFRLGATEWSDWWICDCNSTEQECGQFVICYKRTRVTLLENSAEENKYVAKEQEFNAMNW